MTESSAVPETGTRRLETTAASGRWHLFLSEPLVWFAVAGAAVFAVFHLIGPTEERTAVQLSDAAVSEIVSYQSELIGRDLTATERTELIKEHVDAEILVREAVARNLHLVDTSVRRRLADHMRFLLGDDVPEPTATDLDKLLADQPERYLTPPTVSFEHIYFPMEGKASAEALMAGIAAGEPVPAEAGTVFWLGRVMESYTPEALGTVLGSGFVNSLSDLSPGDWAGPIQSTRGWHLVRVMEFRNPEPLPEPLMEQRLREDWLAAERERIAERGLAGLRERYDIVLPDFVPDDD